jgi:hypothetical protein
MNKRQVISSLNNIAEDLDNNALYYESNIITNVMKKIAQNVFQQKIIEQNNYAAQHGGKQTPIVIRPKVLDLAKMIKKENAYDTVKWSKANLFDIEIDFLENVINKTVDPDMFDYNNISNYNYKSPTQKLNDELLKNKVKNSYENENYLQSSASRYFLEQINLYFKTGQINPINSYGFIGLKSEFSKKLSILKEGINVNDNLSSREKQYLNDILQKGVAQMMRGQRPQQVYVPFEKIEH